MCVRVSVPSTVAHHLAVHGRFMYEWIVNELNMSKSFTRNPISSADEKKKQYVLFRRHGWRCTYAYGINR